MNKEIKELHPHFESVVYTEDQIEKRIKELALWVDETYKDSKELVIVGLLKGCLPFLAQLIKNVNTDHAIDFMIASSYEGADKSSGSVKIILDLKTDIFQKDVLIVEDIVESGITLNKVMDLLKSRQPKSIKILTLVDKPNFRKQAIVPDKSGFVLDKKLFLVGYGLDYKEKYRNVPYIGVFNKKYL
ncbi:hypoxanthine phosphoribosyltransferase [Mycoplasma testudineum]|uniref:Hypoxanthine phosphoribosyltransferase n=1 Tax=Mycoplasma testudineum TaxID=244584 RepID=A0A4R6IAA7_9MOLU|nr:hypoxanthine phosphoribosyltransferase [Mycoplasma testudineum]OYD26542.1 hypoxanthine phosphoribosyltransferase [Mycoplasma testudineum]TDO19120.1 hypoxanthine phosphoribosyltransferase [Mycoplasma testudineum]